MSAFIPAEIMEQSMAASVHWKAAYQVIEDSARNFLLAAPPGKTYTTKELVAGLYNGNDHFTTQRIFAALKALAAHGLKDCWSPGQAAKVSFGRTPGAQKIWAAPAVKRCPHCNGVL